MTQDEPDKPMQCKCERVELNGGVVTVPDSIEHVGDCGQGCCDDYRCKLCGHVFRVEWPD